MGKKLREEDYVGKKYGCLTVIRQLKEKKGNSYLWEFVCDCGNHYTNIMAQVKSGNTISCGCQKARALIKYNNKQNTVFIGNKYGKLTVIKNLGLFPYSEGHRRTRYLCLCECGETTEAWGFQLSTGAKKSCGCLCSQGEEEILSLLKENHIEFKHDCSLPLIFEQTGKHLRFDFIIYQDGKLIRLIEFDGRQHFQGMDEGIWSSGNTLKEIRERDNLKNQFSINNHIPLVRIPYTRLGKITIEDLLGSAYLIEGDDVLCHEFS